MASSLRDRTLSGIFWSFLQKAGSRGIELLVTVILARLLSPSDFGLIGMLVIFIALSQAVVQAGFSQALIQKKDADEEDFSSVFYINLVVSVLMYLILYFGAPAIANFYKQPKLISLTRVLSLVFVVNAFGYVQETRLKKELDFKRLMYIHLPSTIISGVVAVYVAYRGYGVWAIVAQRLFMRFLFTIQLWIYAQWRPLWAFNKKKAKKLFTFGGNLMVVSIIQTIYQNIYQIVIGKVYPINILGYYQNANSLTRTPIYTISSVISSVTFPAFSTIQNDNVKLKDAYKKVIQQVFFWICPILVIAGVLAEPIFRFVLTEKWLPAIPYFRILCIGFVFSPLNVYNINLLNIKGRSDLFLKLEIIKKVLETIGIGIALYYSIWALIWFQSIFTLLKYLINSYYSGRFIDYSLKHQLRDIRGIFLISCLTGLLVLLINESTKEFDDFVRIIAGLIIGTLGYWGMAKLFKNEAYQDLKLIVFQTKEKIKK